MSETIHMIKMKIAHNRAPVVLLLILLLLSGCVAGQTSFLKGNVALEQKDYDQAVLEYLTAVTENPQKSDYRLRLNYSRGQAALTHKQKGDDYFKSEQYLAALQEYQLAADLDGSLYSAFEGLRSAQKYLRAEKLGQEADIQFNANHYKKAAKIVDEILTLIPDHESALQLRSNIKQSQYAVVDGVELEVTSTQPINLNFRETKLPDVFDILTKLSGINFILDEGVRDNKTTLFLEQATFAQALELLLRMNKLDKKILNGKTIILFPKTRDKQKQFEDQIIQTFYLSHIDAKKAVNMLRTMLQVRKVYVQEELNAIVIRDTPDVIRLAKKMIEATDRGNSEVIFDLELIEVNHNDTRELGLKLSHYSIGGGLSIPGSGKIVSSGLSAGGATTNLIDFSQGLDRLYSIPTASFRFMKTLVDAEILANPKIRVRNKTKAKVHVGSREPVITVTINDTQTSENVQYIDVGVKLDVEPTIQLDNTIVTKLSLEVSNVSGRERTANGTAVITISSTTADTTLTLKDGEQTIIGGLIRNDSSVTKSKIPVLGDIPFLGELFNGTDTTESKREILLSITPHIVKSVIVPLGDTASIWSGGEDDLKFGRNFGTFIDEYKTGQQVMQPRTENFDSLEATSPGATMPISDIPPAKSFAGFLEGGNTLQMTELVDQIILQKNSPLIFIEGTQQATVTDIIDVFVRVEELNSLSSISLPLKYDPALLELLTVRPGKLLEQQEFAPEFSYTDQKGNGQVQIDINAREQSHGTSGTGMLFQLQFRTLQPGVTEIIPERMKFVLGNNELINVEAFGLLIEITQ